ncbi:MAG: deoxyribonuclease V [Armatimonadetes bacterium]|nr:deoxyribonuclease V [Armatimonadota bacterium]
MHYQNIHRWDMTPEEARAQQKAMRRMVSLEDGFGPIKTAAGVDLSFNEERNEGHAVVVVLSYPDFEVIEARYATAALLMPYIPGLLSFRESPVALEAFAQVQAVPDIIFVDGQGQAHPRGFGIACHLGVLLDVPSVGVAKSRLYGEYDADALPDETPAAVPLFDKARRHVIGSVVRTKPRTNPLFISPGHRVSVDSATRLALDCLRGYRLPEPTRQAHNLITAYKKTGAAALPDPPPDQKTLPLE